MTLAGRMLVVFASFIVVVPARALGDGEVHWRGKTYSLDAPPKTLGNGARDAIVKWRVFAKALELRCDVDEKERLVVFSPASTNYIEQVQPLLTKTLDLCDRALPIPERSAPSTWRPAPPTPNKPEPLPEDPEEPPAGAPSEVGTSSGPSEEELARASRGTAVMLFLKGRAEYAQSLDFLVIKEPYLKSWVNRAATQFGYVLERPLCGAMVINQDQEEWNPDNEVVNRCMQVAVLGRFGRQPYWAMQGLGWYAEFDVLRCVYCFPYRDDFVSVAEHTDWDKMLAARFKGRDVKLDLADFADWKRGTWNTATAHAAWGAIDHLARKEKGELSRFFDDVRRETDAKSRRDKADGTWDTDAEFELSLADQERLLVAHFGAKILEEMRDAWRKAGDSDR
ncbi:MAG: hypothetical protein K8S98_17350 [Planctomycetes bacterium]|nr:hypothetical protein [Planctomycetota bacterium]